MAYTIIKPKSHQDWLNERKNGIGSSEAGTIMGVNKYDTPLALWRRKMELDPPIAENEAMEMGHLLEPIVVTRWERKTGIKVIKNTAGDWIAVDNNKPFLRVSPDRLYWLQGEKHNKYNRGILECKTTDLDIQTKIITDKDGNKKEVWDVPLYWECQLQYQLGVTGFKEGYLAWITRGRKFACQKYEFHEGFYNTMVTEIEKFYTFNIQGNIEPDITTAEDVLLKYVRSTDGKELEADVDTIIELQQLTDIKSQITALETRKKMLEDSIKVKMGDAETIIANGNVLATWKTGKDKQTFDSKSFAADHPELYKQYTKTTTGNRTFLNKTK